jgi:hypothetical protein
MNSIKFLLIFIISLTVSIANASYIKCYSNGKVIYAGHARDIEFESDTQLFSFLDKNKKTVFILGDCVITT